MISAAFVLALLSAASLATAQQTCSATQKCGKAAPCCSPYGYCGTDSFCLGGCNPQYSNSWDSCAPAPICQNATYTFHDNSRIVNSTVYNGNSSAYDWTIDSGTAYNLNSSAGEMALLLTETNGGTKLSSTKYVWYGQITAKLKATKWAGVVTAFITMSDVKDEIDWEWPGANTSAAQSNYFWLGNVNYPPTSGQTEGVSGDTNSDYHTYTINWQPDQLDWSIDGQFVRSVKKSDTIVNGVAQYPTTPARIQLSVWPAGISSSAAGTVEWAGGMINWQDPDYTADGGHFAAVFESVSVQCAQSSNTSLPNTPRSYVYSGLDSQGVPVAYISNATTLINGARSNRLAMPTTATLAATGGAAAAVAFAMFALA